MYSGLIAGCFSCYTFLYLNIAVCTLNIFIKEGAVGAIWEVKVHHYRTPFWINNHLETEGLSSISMDWQY